MPATKLGLRPQSSGRRPNNDLESVQSKPAVKKKLSTVKSANKIALAPKQSNAEVEEKPAETTCKPLPDSMFQTLDTKLTDTIETTE